MKYPARVINTEYELRFAGLDTSTGKPAWLGRVVVAIGPDCHEEIEREVARVARLIDAGEPEEVDPDPEDLAALEEAAKINDGRTKSLEQILEERGDS